jgi:hypothetical protein
MVTHLHRRRRCLYRLAPVLLVSMLLLGAGGAPPPVRLEVGTAAIVVGAHVCLPLILHNDIGVRLMEFTLRDSPDELSLQDLRDVKSGRTINRAFSVQTNQAAANRGRGILIGLPEYDPAQQRMDAACLAPGSGEIARLCFVDDLAPCTPDATVRLRLEEVKVGDCSRPRAKEVKTAVTDGAITCRAAGP